MSTILFLCLLDTTMGSVAIITLKSSQSIVHVDALVVDLEVAILDSKNVKVGL